jgi:hypothetical protein
LSSLKGRAEIETAGASETGILHPTLSVDVNIYKNGAHATAMALENRAGGRSVTSGRASFVQTDCKEDFYEYYAFKPGESPPTYETSSPLLHTTFHLKSFIFDNCLMTRLFKSSNSILNVQISRLDGGVKVLAERVPSFEPSVI